MKIKILGTAAYERVPAMFCQCVTCNLARKLKGKNIRSQAQTLIDDDLLVDFGQDNYLHYLNSGADYTKIKNILITHTHPDHFMPDELRMTTGGFAIHDMTENIGIWGNQTCAELVSKVEGAMLCEAHAVAAYETFQMGKYTVTALPASHGTENPLVYIITDGQATLLYNNDTGLWKDDVYQFVEAGGYHFDGVISDCTMGFKDTPGKTHMSLGNNMTHRQRLLAIGAVTENTKWVVSHFSHNGLRPEDKAITAEELERVAAEMGMIAAYDGITITL